MSTTGATDRLARLLNLVPYLLARPGIEIVEAAADLGVTETQLRDDLELLWVCGLPGYGPGDLIDMAFDGDHVTVTYDAGIDRPLRLTPDEALALVVALRMLAEMPGADGRDAIERALAKIETAAGDLADAPVAVRMAGGETGADRLAAIRHVVERRHALRITYYTATRDETSERVVDPMRVLIVDGRAYLEAWCRQAEAVRLFRVDRIDALHRARRAGRAAAAGAPQRPVRRRLPGQPRPAAGHAAGGPLGAVDHRVLPVRVGRGGRRRRVAGHAAGQRPGLGPPARARPRLRRRGRRTRPSSPRPSATRPSRRSGRVRSRRRHELVGLGGDRGRRRSRW